MHSTVELFMCLSLSSLRAEFPEDKTVLDLIMKVKVKVVSDFLQPHGLYNPWNSPGQNTGVGSLSLLQGIFLTQGSDPGLLHCRWILKLHSLFLFKLIYKNCCASSNR